jgi:hypothetical protein
MGVPDRMVVRLEMSVDGDGMETLCSAVVSKEGTWRDWKPTP